VLAPSRSLSILRRHHASTFPATQHRVPAVLQVAKRFYLLFQQHTNVQRSRHDGLYGGAGFSQLVQLGPRVALALPDQRTERTKDQVGWLGGVGWGWGRPAPDGCVCHSLVPHRQQLQPSLHMCHTTCLHCTTSQPSLG
jgi:hypothetical protein